MSIPAILVLMQTAMSLLSAVQADPNLPESFRQEAFQTANIAIDFATEAIKENTSTHTQLPSSDPIPESIINEGTTTLSSPTGLIANNISHNQVTLFWNSSPINTGVSGYHIFRNKEKIAETANSHFTDTDLTEQTNYIYTVVAIDATGNVSQPSKDLSLKTEPAPYFVAEFEDDPAIRTLTIKTKMNNGEIIPNKKVEIRGISGSSSLISTKTSNDDGIINFNYGNLLNKCGETRIGTITIEADGKKYSKTITAISEPCYNQPPASQPQPEPLLTPPPTPQTNPPKNCNSRYGCPSA